jgi:hypothetical protein
LGPRRDPIERKHFQICEKCPAGQAPAGTFLVQEVSRFRAVIVWNNPRGQNNCREQPTTHHATQSCLYPTPRTPTINLAVGHLLQFSDIHGYRQSSAGHAAQRECLCFYSKFYRPPHTCELRGSLRSSESSAESDICRRLGGSLLVLPLLRGFSKLILVMRAITVV